MLVIQGINAGGHGLRKGAGTMTLLLEVSDALRDLGSDTPILAAGGFADDRGVAAALGIGVAGDGYMLGGILFRSSSNVVWSSFGPRKVWVVKRNHRIVSQSGHFAPSESIDSSYRHPTLHR